MKTTLALLFLAGGSAFMSACSSQDDDSSDDSASRGSTLIWESCGDRSPLQCTTLDVSVDPAEARSGKISLALNRLPSIREEREGIVLINPGGPGGSGVELLEELSGAGALPLALRERFDFIGFDPRGVGGSAAVDCSEFGSTEINEYLVDEQDIARHVEERTATATSCQRKYGEYLRQLGSRNVVHDMDAIRRAAAEDRIHYIGYSYGTRLGALYLQTYPDNSGHFVLDGSVRPEPDVELLVAGAVEAMQASLVSILEECRSIDPSCSGETLLDELESKAVELEGDGREEELEIVLVLAYYAAENPALGPFLLPPLYDYLRTDDIGELRDIHEGALGELLDDGDDTTERAVMCADDATRPAADDLERLLSDYNQVSDFFAETYLSQAGMCSGWPATSSELPLITTTRAPPALVVGGTTDTLTLARWSEEMARSIAGYYLESNHLGHTSVFNGNSSCVDAVAEEFLLTGLQPTQSVCLSE